jgi:hypothetical protein
MSTRAVEQVWRLDAACLDVPGDWWFPEAPWVVEPLALRTCRSCPVRRDCLLYALSHADIWYGIWAGLTAHELARLRRRILDGDPPADVVADAERIADHRVGKTVFRASTSPARPTDEAFARQSAAIATALQDADLVSTVDAATGRAA